MDVLGYNVQKLPGEAAMKKHQFLTGNMLKIIAAVSMLLDHGGLLFFPREMGFRIAGRLAFPIFAYMIAEGCKYTRNRWRYWGMIAGLAALCQIVYFLAAGDTYLSVLVTFSLAIPVVWILQEVQKKKTLFWALALAAMVAAVGYLNRVLTIDYGYWGCMLPVWVAAIPGAPAAGLVIGLILLSWDIGGVQWYGLLAVPLLWCYNGTVGRRKMKYFFYIFYPAHLVILQALAWALG